MSVSLRFQSSGAVPGDGRPVIMHGPSLTIGRGPENDLVLPDPDRQISKTHCVIENHNGNVVAVDLSTNGTFLNYGKIALGRTPTPLNDGDVLIMGAYELVVNVGVASNEPAAPLGDERASFGNAGRAPDPMQLLDDAAPGGDFLDSLLGPNKPKGPGQFRGKQEDFDLLPPLGEDGILGPAPEAPTGPAMQDNSAGATDAFRAPKASRSAIPDDWDDLLAPTPPAAAPSYAPPPPAAPVLIPDDDIFGLGPTLAAEPPAAVPAPVAAPVAAPAVAAAPVAPPHIPEPLMPEPAMADLPQAIPDPTPGGTFDPFATAAPLVQPPAAPVAAPVQAPVAPVQAAPPPAAHAAAPFDPFATDPNRPGRDSPVADSADLDDFLAVAAPPASPFAAPPQPVAGPTASPFATVTPPPAAPDASPFATVTPSLPAAAPIAAPPVAAAPITAALPQTPTVTNADAARAFLAAMDATELRITDAELPDTMARLGKTLKSMIVGLREILMTRTSIKSEFRIEQTMVNVGGNNPLKFSISPEQAIEAMVKPTVRGYLPAEKAAAQALEDIKAHEVAMVTGMEAALKGVLAKLNPQVLTTKIEAKGGFGGFLKSRKAQYWEVYEAMYAEISDQAENDFHELFAREFAQAYKDQLARLKQSQN